MERKIIFKDTASGTEFALPITPPSFKWTRGINIETININALGDVALAGYESLGSAKIEAVFPARSYPFVNSGASTEPYTYIEQIEKWCTGRTVLRYIVSNTPINEAVLIESIQYGEQDGTNDVYAEIALKGYKYLSAEKIETSTATGNGSRTDEETAVSAAQSYLIVKGDTLSAICRKFYGDASLYPKLASYNGIKNPNLIYAGNTITIPDKSLL